MLAGIKFGRSVVFKHTTKSRSANYYITVGSTTMCPAKVIDVRTGGGYQRHMLPPPTSQEGGQCPHSHAYPCCTRPDYEISYEILRISNYKVCSSWLTIHFNSLVQPWLWLQWKSIISTAPPPPPPPTVNIFLRLWKSLHYRLVYQSVATLTFTFPGMTESDVTATR